MLASYGCGLQAPVVPDADFLLVAGAVMEMVASVVFECPFDEETLKSMQDLRIMRLKIAKQQLANVAKTVEEMIARGLLEDGNRKTDTDELRLALKDKVAALEVRQRASDTVYSDEIEIYLELLAEKQ